MPYQNFNCALCHTSPPSLNDGGRAFEAENWDFFCPVPALNTPPVADAGPDQAVTAGDLVTLDGSGSSDADGDSLSYQWELTSAPGGSSATLSDATAVMPTFTADVAGTYIAQLIVNDGTDDSPADRVTITAGGGNTAPVADAGPDQAVTTGDLVTLDGSGSSDVDNDPLTYSWQLTVPPGSSATLSDPAAVSPTFTADVAGAYVAELVVNDGSVDSPADSVTVTARDDTPGENTPPVADAGPDQSVRPGDSVSLDGSASSDADNDDLTYAWSFVSTPPGSAAALSDATSVTPSFTADVAGDYVVQLIVNDGTDDSPADTVTIRADADNTAPVADAGTDQNAAPGDTVILDGSASSDADGDSLTFSWSPLSAPAGSTATLSDATAQNPSFVPDEIGEYVWQLVVNDGQADSAPDTVMVKVAEQPVALPEVALRLRVKSHGSRGRGRHFRQNARGSRAMKIYARIRCKEGCDTDDGISILTTIAVTKPDGSTEVLEQERDNLKKRSRVRTRFVPTQEGEYIVDAQVVDESGNELASESKSVVVRSKKKRCDDDDHDDDDDDDDHRKDRRQKSRGNKKCDDD